jgi:hypothetical protein
MDLLVVGDGPSGNRASNATLLVDPTNFASLALAVRAGFVEATRVDGQVLMKCQGVARDQL